MDFENLVADQVMILDRHYTSGRCGRSIDKVIVHHNAADLSVAGCHSVWESREASAHYQVCSDGTIGQLVWDRDTAWHASDFYANTTSIGIEHADCQSDPWRISGACLDAGAHLVAAVCRFYGLGRPEWGVNLFGHSDFAATECPASLSEGGSQHDEYVARAQWWYDVMTGAAAPEEEDMTDEQAQMLKDVWDILHKYYGWQYKKVDDGDGVYDTVDMHQMQVDTWEAIPKLLAMEAAQTEAIKALAKMQGADPDAVAKAVSNAVEAKLKTIRLEVSTDAKEG